MTCTSALSPVKLPNLRVADPVEQRSSSNAPESVRPDPLRALVGPAVEGDSEALRTILLEVGGAMLRTVRRVLGANHPSIDDVTQDAAFGFTRALSTFRGDSTVTHFAVRVALRTALQARRHFAFRERMGDFTELGAQIADPSLHSPLELAISQERRRILRSVMDQLSEPIAAAIALHFMMGFTVLEIAAAEEVSPNTVWSRLRLGKQALKKMLEGDDRLQSLMTGGSP